MIFKNLQQLGSKNIKENMFTMKTTISEKTETIKKKQMEMLG